MTPTESGPSAANQEQVRHLTHLLSPSSISAMWSNIMPWPPTTGSCPCAAAGSSTGTGTTGVW